MQRLVLLNGINSQCEESVAGRDRFQYNTVFYLLAIHEHVVDRKAVDEPLLHISLLHIVSILQCVLIATRAQAFNINAEKRTDAPPVSTFPEGHLMHLCFVSWMSSPGKVLRVASN